MWLKMRSDEKVRQIFYAPGGCSFPEVGNETENLLNNNTPTNIVRVCAPMVRYSKSPFRHLIRMYGCDLAYTPMIMASSFAASSRARATEIDFYPIINSSIADEDRPLIVQFGANNAETLRDAAQYVVNACDGIDINCGCPQRWALKEKIGAALIDQPELLSDMIRQLNNSLPSDSRLMLSIKIRIHDDIKRTVDLCRRADKCGLSFLAVHGRTVHERHQPAHWDAIKVVVDSMPKYMPVIANGDVKCLSDAEKVCAQTGARGAMVARAILNNPALFAGFDSTTIECVQSWLDLLPKHFSMDSSRSTGVPERLNEAAEGAKLSFRVFLHHTQWMLEDRLNKQERVLFDNMRTYRSVLTFMQEKFDVTVPQCYD